MLKNLLPGISLLLVLSCTTRQEKAPVDSATIAKQDTVPPLKVTVLSELPDTLQPKHFLLEEMPKPIVIAVPKTKNISVISTSPSGEITKSTLEVPVPVLSPV